MTIKSLHHQLEVLNNAYNPHRINFSLKGADLVVQRSWLTNCLQSVSNKYFRKGTYADLNVYFFPRLGCIEGQTVPPNQVVWGYSTFSSYRIALNTNVADKGIILRSDSVPGSNSEMNLGMTLVNEVGHWFRCEYVWCARVS
jgi:hypothetical protein